MVNDNPYGGLLTLTVTPPVFNVIRQGGEVKLLGIKASSKDLELGSNVCIVGARGAKLIVRVLDITLTIQKRETRNQRGEKKTKSMMLFDVSVALIESL